MTRVRSRFGRTDDGAAAVEFALISVPLVLLLVGIIQFGFIFYTQIMLTQSAREGARALSLNLSTGTPGSCDAACVSAAEQKAKDSFTSPTAGFTLSGSNFETVTVCPSGATQSNEAVMVLNYKVDAAFLFTVTLKGKSSMPCGG